MFSKNYSAQLLEEVVDPFLKGGSIIYLYIFYFWGFYIIW